MQEFEPRFPLSIDLHGKTALDAALMATTVAHGFTDAITERRFAARCFTYIGAVVLEGAGLTATGHVYSDLARWTITQMALLRAWMTAFRDLVAGGFAGWHWICTGLAVFTVQ